MFKLNLVLTNYIDMLTYRLTAVLCENIENHEVVKINDCLSN